MEKEEEIKHPSFGVISISRVQGTRRALFGSSVEHQHFINLSIHRASFSRELNGDWIHAESIPIVEVEMSTTQFADAITNLNHGTGTPVTLIRIEGKEIPEGPFENKVATFTKEFESSMKKIVSDLNPDFVGIEKLLQKPSIGKKDKEEILEFLRLIKQDLKSNMPYVKKQFDTQIEKTLSEAKGEFEAFVEAKVHQLGLEGFKAELKKVGNAEPVLKLDK